MDNTSDTDLIQAFHYLDDAMILCRESNLYETDKEYYNQVMGLSFRQMNALATVSRLTITITEGIPLKDLAKSLHISVPSASLLVDVLVKKGLFIRKENPRDRRSICIKLSPDGQDRFDMLRSSMDSKFGELADILSPEDKAHLCRIALIIYKQIILS